MFAVILERFDRPGEVRTFARRAEKKIRRAAPLLAVAIVAAFLPTFARAADTVGDCRIGAYRLTDESVVDIGASDDGRLKGPYGASIVTSPKLPSHGR
jgi:hypothetical protein